MRRCTKCVMPETWEGITFDEQGVCSICRQNEIKNTRVNWQQRGKTLREICEKYKNIAEYQGDKFDCLVPFSGGKDSAYTLWVLKKTHGMSPLAYTYNNGAFTPEGWDNLINIPKKLDCAHLIFSPSHSLVKKLCIEATRLLGDFCWHCNTGIVASSLRMAIQWKIPLIVWGEPSVEYITSGQYTYKDMQKLNEESFKTMCQGGLPTGEFVGKQGITQRDMDIYTFPSVTEIGGAKIFSIYLGNYEPWDPRKQVELIKRELGWKERDVEGSYLRYDKTDCEYIGVRDYQKYLKRGLGRSCSLSSIDVRNGRMSREEALKIIAEYDGKRPQSLDKCLEEMGMTDDEFLWETRKIAVLTI